mmetsp:Transcript_2321/g.4586  ORF Transcript_2321/g.4586 Transcript_2321/m.4586 type:complete len:315 (+) Transcript_2321:860-1804(+)
MFGTTFGLSFKQPLVPRTLSFQHESKTFTKDAYIIQSMHIFEPELPRGRAGAWGHGRAGTWGHGSFRRGRSGGQVDPNILTVALGNVQERRPILKEVHGIIHPKTTLDPIIGLGNGGIPIFLHLHMTRPVRAARILALEEVNPDEFFREHEVGISLPVDAFQRLRSAIGIVHVGVPLGSRFGSFGTRRGMPQAAFGLGTEKHHQSQAGVTVIHARIFSGKLARLDVLGFRVGEPVRTTGGVEGGACLGIGGAAFVDGVEEEGVAGYLSGGVGGRVFGGVVADLDVVLGEEGEPHGGFNCGAGGRRVGGLWEVRV